VAQVDEIPLSRPKRNIARDFADGGEQNGLREAGMVCINSRDTNIVLCAVAVLLAEVVANYFPKLVELHNYR
jgi:hypothetical protein